MSSVANTSFAGTPFLKGTVGAHLNRLDFRAKKLLVENETEIRGKRILDIASNDGRFSHICLELGAKHVHGVEGRQHHVDDANRYLAALGHNPSRYTFTCDDFFDFSPRCESGQFDTILCFGFLYHTIRQVEMLQEFRRLRPQTIIVDTLVHKQRQWIRWLRILWRLRARHLKLSRFRDLVRTTEADEIMQLAMEDASRDGSSISHGGTPIREAEREFQALAMNFHPTSSVLERLLDYHGFQSELIDWFTGDVTSWHTLKDYKTLQRVSYLAHPRERWPDSDDS